MQDWTSGTNNHFVGHSYKHNSKERIIVQNKIQAIKKGR